MFHPTYADLVRPAEKMRGYLYDVLLVIGGSLLVALFAQISIPLQPVPVTGQTFAVLLVGALLGSRRGGAAMIAYLAEGAMGLPVFAQGKSGLALAGPTGGYLIGFVAAAFVTGLMAERGWDRKPLTTAAAMGIGNLVIYALGVSWLASMVGLDNAITHGLIVFLPGDAIKIILAVILLPLGWKLVGEQNKQE